MKYLDKITNILIVIAAIGMLICTIVWLTEPSKTVYQINLNDKESAILIEVLDNMVKGE